MSRYSLEEFIADLRRGQLHGVFIDDTGSPGLTASTPHLHPERKSWIAVVVSPRDIAEVLEQMPRAIGELKRATGGGEFHFTDIYAGRKAFKNVDLSVRLAVFEFMAYIFARYKFPIIVQTLDPHSVARIHSGASFPKQVGPFNLTKQNDLALFFLLIRVKWFLEQKLAKPGPWARVFIDEGFKKSGVAIKIPSFERYFVDGLVCFVRSDLVQPIQLADFAAFALNRTQL